MEGFPKISGLGTFWAWYDHGGYGGKFTKPGESPHLSEPQWDPEKIILLCYRAVEGDEGH